MSEADAFFAYVMSDGLPQLVALFGGLVVLTGAYVWLVAGVSRATKL